MNGAFLGPSFPAAEIADFVNREGVEHESLPDTDRRAARVAAALAAGALVGWFTGRMEFGPRALGHRSILADPRSPTARERLNSKVKERQSFRPFAPAVLADRAAEYFDLAAPSPYMLLTAPVGAQHRGPDSPPGPDLASRASAVRGDLPAVTHVDGSARVQTVTEGTNPEFHRLLAAFARLTGCPVLLNTSFNGAHEPIVCTPSDALATARRIGLDLLVMEDCVIPLSPRGRHRSAPVGSPAGTGTGEPRAGRPGTGGPEAGGPGRGA